ncbi:LutC/YkgG family protein [Syntrophobacter fumaroxidans]|uniref:LUD domain-containing protein n=1 Tax=Syntrophobacter fumaroxidans (strain DSM 10017 / MPOB) TaxID=335543 RepID=A0LF89_SYNFM|nr:lactate utilization protein [Syntrophobacter fumaroxidans]ABK16091.1 protein of unknown function DUF162 [Syntrophobacter fumaroxidans MPOB]
MDRGELIAKLKERAAAVQSVALEIGSFDAAMRYAVDLTARQGGRSIAAPGLPDDRLSDLATLCAGRDIELLTGGLRQRLSGLHTGLTEADWGIAETATLVLDSSAEDIRIATMLVETHVAILPASRLRATAFDLEPELGRMLRGRPSYLAFISGASRTADIERVLTVGVHGPQELHILILEDNGS